MQKADVQVHAAPGVEQDVPDSTWKAAVWVDKATKARRRGPRERALECMARAERVGGSWRGSSVDVLGRVSVGGDKTTAGWTEGVQSVANESRCI